jgi:hypothetical protein
VDVGTGVEDGVGAHAEVDRVESGDQPPAVGVARLV